MSDFAGFPRAGLEFLTSLAEHNDKEWFEAHRAAWDEQVIPALSALGAGLKQRLENMLPQLQFVPRAGQSLFRPNRDVRFSRDKRPYETHAAALLWEGADKQLAPSIYLQISPHEVLIRGGLALFEEAQLDRFRKRVLAEETGDALSSILSAAKKEGLKLEGEKTNKPPRGFAADHPRAELSKHKGLTLASTKKGDDWLTTPDLLDAAEETARAYAPLHAWLCAYVAA